MKTQRIRLADVFLIGPIMIYAGLKLRESDPTLGHVLAGLGSSTFVYNGRNWLKQQRHGRLYGGRADSMDSRRFDPRQLRMGVQVEREHTDDPDIAREIAMDHLVEDPRYYTKLRRAGL
jgi:hypothetical protein